MANMNQTLQEALEIDGAIGAGIGNWDAGLCLGAAGDSGRLDIEVVMAGYCQVVKARMMATVGSEAEGGIVEILITLEDQVHLIRPLKRRERLFLCLAIDKTAGNLGMARHRLQTLEAALQM